MAGWQRFLFVTWVMLNIVWAAGCGGRGTRGGTRGSLRSDRGILPDVEVTVYSGLPEQRVQRGSGVSTGDGTFSLHQPDGKAPLWLEPGEYAFTVQSVGPDPMVFPSEYNDPRRTPLLHTLTGTSDSVDLVLPVPQPPAASGRP